MSVADSCFILPVAVEYVFGNHRLPEIRLNLGELRWKPDEQLMSVFTCCDFVVNSLETAQNELAEAVQRGDGSKFESLLDGGTGTGGIYGWWERVRKRVRPRRHTSDFRSSEENRS